MISAQALSNFDCETGNREHCFQLRKSVAAIQAMPSDFGDEPKLGMITHLPEGAEVTACGAGFNERTMRVRWGGGQYFVFLQDL